MKKVKIRAWMVHGQSDTYGPYFTKEEANKVSSYSCGGWGEVKEVIKVAELVSTRRSAPYK